MLDHRRVRLSNLLRSGGTIALGLSVHRWGAVFGPVAHDMLGDALWALMMWYGLGVLRPQATPNARAMATLCFCTAVELSQLIHVPVLDALRDTTLGGLALGSGFDPRDLLSYTMGVGAALLLSRLDNAPDDAPDDRRA